MISTVQSYLLIMAHLPVRIRMPARGIQSHGSHPALLCGLSARRCSNGNGSSCVQAHEHHMWEILLGAADMAKALRTTRPAPHNPFRLDLVPTNRNSG